MSIAAYVDISIAQEKKERQNKRKQKHKHKHKPKKKKLEELAKNTKFCIHLKRGSLDSVINHGPLTSYSF